MKAFVFSTLAGLGLLAAPSAASASPWQIGAQGIIEAADGTLPTGASSVTFRIYDSAGAEQPAWEETVGLDLVDGRFDTALPTDAEDASLGMILEDSDEAWLSVVIEGDVELVRTPLFAAPYAVVAARARTVAATGVAFDDVVAQLGATDGQSALEALAARVRALEDGGSGASGGGVPSGAVLMFRGACPNGWAEVTELAGRFPVGVGPSMPIDTQGGTATHGHLVTVASAGDHGHGAGGLEVAVGYANDPAQMPTIACSNASAPGYSATEPFIVGRPTSSACAGGIGAATPYHKHQATVAGSVADGGAHVHDASVADAGHLPPFHVLRFCAKP